MRVIVELRSDRSRIGPMVWGGCGMIAESSRGLMTFG